MDRIGVRELRQHASRYLARVARGETIEVTDRGRPVALLTPVPVDSWEQMIAEGRVHPAEEPGGLLDVKPLPPVDPPLSEVLTRLREDERW
jgi:prevent-host-death family protein